MAEPLSVSEFSSKVKSKYPEYASVDDATLAQKIVEKYPEYADRVKLDTSVSPKAATEKKVAEPKEAPKEPSPVAPSKKPDVVESVSSPTPKTSDIVKGVGAEIGIGVSGQVAGTAIGTAIMPGAGTAIGYGVGSIGSGIAGSIAAQRIEGQEDISWGRAIAAGLINLVPGGAAKGAKGAAKITTGMVGRAAAKESAKGVAFGATEATSRAIMDEGRLPTKEELAQYGGAGALFGGALGAATPKIGKTVDKLLGKTAKQIDDDIANGALTAKELKALNPDMPDEEIQATVVRLAEKAKARAVEGAVAEPTPLGRLRDRVLSVVAPSKVIGREARNEALSFNKRVVAADELGGRIARRVTKLSKKDPSMQGKVDSFLSGGDLDPSLGSLRDELKVYQNKMDELQGELINQLKIDQMASMESGKLSVVTDKIMKLKERAESLSGKKKSKIKKKIKKLEDKIDSTPKLIRKIEKSRAEKDYSRREYRMFTDSEFVPDIKLRAKAQQEIAAKILQKNKRLGWEASMDRANKQLDELESRSARSKKNTQRPGSGRKGHEAPLKQKKNPGEAERAWLGEITDTGERMRGTLSGVARLVARKQTDRNVANIMLKNGLAVKSENQIPGMQELKLKAGEATGLHVMPEVQASVNRLYLDGAQQRSSSPIIAGLQDMYSSAVGLSKATKVLLNPPSYAVQVYGNTMNLLGMGVNPFRGAYKGARLAMSEFGGLEKMMSKGGKTEREAFLRELNDMARYGIKNENIIESDIRDAFERGLFTKMTEKPVGFMGKAYSVPDTVGRYVGWKAQQASLKKIYPDLNSEELKRLAAEVINDTYQNYERLSGTVKSLSRMGVMPQFASFTAEFMRNQYNQAKIIKQMLSGKFGADLGLDLSTADLKAMRIEGGKRLAALATIYGGTAGAISALNSDGGITDENEDHIRELLPEWDKNKSLGMRLSEDGKQMSYANMSYIAPQALGLAALDAGMSGDPIEGLSEVLVDEFIGEGSFVNRAMMEAINNRNARGQQISSKEGDVENARERLGYFFKETFRPGAAREFKKFDEALRDVGDLTTGQVLARQAGYRVNTVDFAENAKYLMMEHKANADMSQRRYTKARDKGTMRPEEVMAMYKEANESRRESMALISRRNENLINRGYSEEERIQVMKDAGVGGKDILNTLQGTYSDIPMVKLPSTSETYNDLGGSMSDKRNQILEIRKSDRVLGNNLMSKWKTERRAEQRGVTSMDSLIRGLDTFEKVEYIRNQPNPMQTLRELRRKRIVGDDVARAVKLGESN